MNLKFFFLSVFILNIGKLYAQSDSTHYFNLRQAQEYALKNNRDIQSSRIDLKIAGKRIWETTAIGLPQISVTGNYQHIFNIPKLAFPVVGFTQNPLVLNENVPGFSQSESVGGLNQYSYLGPDIALAAKNNATFDFTFSQLLFSGEYIVGLQASRVYRKLSEQQLIKTENDVRESVTNSYYMVLALSQNMDILNESLEVTTKTWHEMQEMYRQGLIQETDADQILIIKSQLENTLFNLNGQKEVSEKLLKMQLGMNFQENIVLTDSINGLLLETNFRLLDTASLDVNKNINYELASTSAQLSRLSLAREKSKFLPSFSAFYQHEEQTNAPQFNFMPPDIIGATMNFTIFSSGQRLSTISQAKLDLEKAELNRINTAQGLTMQFETAKNDYITAYKTYLTSDKNLRLAKKIYERSLVSFHEGIETSLDVAQNQRQYLNTESDYINAIVKLLDAKAKLDNLLNLY